MIVMLIVTVVFLLLTMNILTGQLAVGQLFLPKAQPSTTTNTNSSLLLSSKTVVHATTSPKLGHNVKITLPAKGQQVLVGKDLMISGISSGNSNHTAINCLVSVIANGIKPYQQATPTGSIGLGDYSKWNFTLSAKYTTIKQGQNKLTAKYSCANVPASLSHYSVNVTGVSTITNESVLRSISSPRADQQHLKLGYAYFLPISASPNNNVHQVKVIVNYTLTNQSILNKTINAIMKVYAANGTLIKTSSFPKGFVVEQSGTEQLATGIKDNKIQQVSVVAQFTTADKLHPLSNPITVKLGFGQKMSGMIK